MRAPKLSLLISIALALTCSVGQASLVYVYDFPGSPGSGLASAQTNGQPANATMSDFTRNGGVTGSGVSGIFGGKNWPTGLLDSNRWMGFTITANSGFFLNLTSLTFDALKNGASGGSGPFQGTVKLFLNGSTTAYATFSFVPHNAPMSNYVFDFADVTYANNVTSATFKFYGWNANDATNELQVDNVSLFGGIDVPEAVGLGPVILVLGCAVFGQRLYRRS